MSSDPEQPRKRTPVSHRLPQTNLNDAIPIAKAIFDLAGPSSKARIAQQLGVSSSSSAFKTRIAAAGYYGLITKDADRYSLTSRGDAILKDDPAGLTARREAVMGTRFGQIIQALGSRVLIESVIASRLEDDFQVPANSAEHLAGVLRRSADDAQLVTTDRFDIAAVEATAHVIPKTEADSSPRPAPKKRTPIDEPDSSATPRRTPAAKPSDAAKSKEVGDPGPFVRQIEISVRIDAGTRSPAEIIEIVKALQASDASLSFQMPDSP